MWRCRCTDFHEAVAQRHPRPRRERRPQAKMLEQDLASTNTKGKREFVPLPDGGGRWKTKSLRFRQAHLPRPSKASFCLLMWAAPHVTLAATNEVHHPPPKNLSAYYFLNRFASCCQLPWLLKVQPSHAKKATEGHGSRKLCEKKGSGHRQLL